MAIIGLVALYGFLGAFVISQFVITRKVGYDRPKFIREAPGRVLGVILSSILIVPALYIMKDDPIRVPWIVSGAVVVVAGLLVSGWARLVLGRNWVGGIGIHKRHELIVTGPYRYVRHPLYSGMLMSGVGLSLLGHSLLYAGAVLLLIGATVIRSLGEEAVMRRQFGQAYITYMARTGHFFPRFRRGKGER